MMRQTLMALLVVLLLPGLSGCPTGGKEDIAPVAPVVNATVTPDSFLEFDNTMTVAGKSQINSAEYAAAYFAAVDPFDERTTLADWQARNLFGSGAEVHALFRDSKDLGYGRDMYARQGADGSIAVYVDNYLVEPLPGDATSYGPINLEAAIARDRAFHTTTNVVEYSPIDPNDPTSDKIVKMFVFGPPDENGRQVRLSSSNLDGRGEKFLPTSCFVCHGGRMYPLDADGSFPTATLKSAKLNLLDPATFEFTNLSEAEQQIGIKQINRMVYEHYLDMDTREDAEPAKWDNRFAAEITQGPYGGDSFPNTAFDEEFVPAGWQQDGNRPEGVETLYKQVVEPHCIACHSLRASNTAVEYVPDVLFSDHMVSLANAVSFSNYEQFISYNDEIIQRVYRQGRMPLSLLNSTRFWANPAGPPTLLANFLSGFDVFDATGNIARPGRPAPLPGANRTVTSPVTQDASGSRLTETFAWAITSMPANAVAGLTNAGSAATTLTADTDGDYVLTLTATNAMASTTADVTLTIDSAMRPRPSELTFAADVIPVLEDTFSGRACDGCHKTDSDEFVGMPVGFENTNMARYKDVLERVNLRDPENSILLIKPTSLQHGGGVRLDRTIAQGNTNYMILLNWIRNGARCGNDPSICN